MHRVSTVGTDAEDEVGLPAGLPQLPEIVDLELAVGIELEDPLAARLPETANDARAVTRVHGCMLDEQPWPVARQAVENRRRAVGRTVVDDDHLDVR